MGIREGKILIRVKLEGKRFRVFEDALIDTGAAFTVIQLRSRTFSNWK